MRLLALAMMIAIGASVCSTGAPENGWRIVYANEAWYRERPEAEREWLGTLRPRTVIEGPNARTALRYDLVTADGAIPVYAPTDALEPFRNGRVVIRGKQIRLDEGVELWPGAITAAGSAGTRSRGSVSLRSRSRSLRVVTTARSASGGRRSCRRSA